MIWCILAPRGARIRGAAGARDIWARVSANPVHRFSGQAQTDNHQVQWVMITISLQSGSSGNCIYVESGATRILVDAGISGIQTEQRLAAHGRDLRQVDALLISHDHDDHIRCAGILQRKYGIPLFVTSPTLAAAQRRMRLGSIQCVHHFSSGASIEIGDLLVETIPTDHDCVDGVAFVFDDGLKRLGVLTDLGKPSERLQEALVGLDGVLLESNYDPEMLAQGPYPPGLKRRVAGDQGHISNPEAAELLKGCADRLEWACLAHLSGTNNTPELALATVRAAVGADLPLAVASRCAVGTALEL